VGKRIALLADAFPPGVGGGERFNADLVRGLRDAGNVVRVFVPLRDADGGDVVRLAGAHVVGVRLMDPIAMFRGLRRLRPDVVLLVGPSPNNAIGACCARLLGIPYVAYFYGDLDWDAPLGRLFGPVYFGLILRGARRVLTYSRVLERALTARRIAKERIVATGIGSDEPLRTPVPFDARTGLVFVGGLGPTHAYKRLDLLVRALPLLPEGLTVIGPGDPAPFRALARQVGVLDRIRFTGVVDEEERRRAVAAARMLVLPSPTSREGFGLVALEAMRLGTPVVIGASAGAAELVERSGFGAIWSGDERALAHAIETVSALDEQALHAAHRRFAAFSDDFALPSVIAAVVRGLDEGP
jgi:glycosyltransferase involved in cell wall biosynthesis